jgi:hypothetical protein
MAAKRTRRRKPLRIVVLSGGTGRTGEQVLRSALAQFEEPDVEIVVKPRVRTSAAAMKVIEAAAAKGAILCHTLVDTKVRELVARECHLRDIHAVDLLGPTVSLLDDHLDGTPRHKPGLSYELNKEQFDRIDAVDFTLAHDDGTRVKDLNRADVVLVGVSRASKSVTCFYLAYRGIRAANVPLVTGFEPPEQLFRLSPDKVVGLMMNPHRLQSIRQARGGAISAAQLPNYTNLRHIAKELRDAQTLMNKHGWRSIDVSYMSVEEVASEIIHMAIPRAA